MKKTQKNIILISVGLFVVSALISYFVFANTSILQSTGIVKTPVAQPKVVGGSKDGKVVFDDALPKTEACPLNGAMYSSQQRQWWEKHRPLGVMIENHEDARPQSGISSSDIVYEAVAEGGITRFLVVFYCQDAGTVGPVRSARTYFVDFISEYGDSPLYAHVGGANMPGPADALGQIDTYGWSLYNDLNQFAIGFPTYWRDPDRLGHPVATEHTMYSTTQNLWKIGADRGLTNVDKKGVSWDTDFTPYTFKDDAANAERPAAQTVSFDFWKDYTAYGVKWVYDKVTNTYARFNGGVKHLDKDNNTQLSTKNVVVLFMRENNADDGYENNLHLLYGDKGTGKAIVFMDGKETQATWSKANRTAHLKITAGGQEVKFDRGRIWFEVLPTGTDVNVQ
ncbi:MAG: DUF3048 domain-containing protein [Candidatus Levyibacteriota bacterium]